jgi:hypothetical protein
MRYYYGLQRRRRNFVDSAKNTVAGILPEVVASRDRHRQLEAATSTWTTDPFCIRRGGDGLSRVSNAEQAENLSLAVTGTHSNVEGAILQISASTPFISMALGSCNAQKSFD